MKDSTLSFNNPGNEEKLQEEFQTLVRVGDTEKATDLLASAAKMKRDWAEGAVKKEADFLRTIDAAAAIGTERSKTGISPRQALIFAAACGWSGDEESSWQSPVERDTLLAWAESHYKGPMADLEIALDALVLQGLFFDVHPCVFTKTCYYCSFETEFLDKIPGTEGYRDLWEYIRKEYDEDYGMTWRYTGLCSGQGRQGPSDAPWGPCIGTSCTWFRTGHKECNWDLEYNPELKRLKK